MRETQTKKWKELRKNAEDEAKLVSENLREQRNKKLTKKKEKGTFRGGPYTKTKKVIRGSSDWAHA